MYFSFPKSWSGVQMSTEAGSKSSGEEEDGLNDGFSELETPHDVNEDDSMSEPELSKDEGVDDDAQNELEPLTNESESVKRRNSKTQSMSTMIKAIMNSPEVAVRKVMEKWVEEGNEVTQTEVSLAMLFLRKRSLYMKGLAAVRVVGILEEIEFQEANYASRVDLISRVLCPARAEEYMNQIPESFRDELVYRSL